MSIYYIVANHTKRQYLCPSDFQESLKYGFGFSPRLSYFLAEILKGSSAKEEDYGVNWKGDSISVVTDANPEYDDIRFDSDEWTRAFSFLKDTDGPDNEAYYYPERDGVRFYDWIDLVEKDRRGEEAGCSCPVLGS